MNLMKMKNLLIGTAAVLVLLFVMGCPQEADNKTAGTPGVLVSAISIAGVTVSPLPASGATIGTAGGGSVVVDTERAPVGDETPDKVYYKPIQPVTVKLAAANEIVTFTVTAPDEAAPDPETMLPGTASGADVTRNIGITLPDADNFPAGQIVWIKVVAADESKTEFYQIAIINKTHDTAVTSIKVNETDVLNNDANQTGHIGSWLGGSSWANAATGLANILDSQKAAVTVAAATRNTNAKVEYAKVTGNAEPASWSAAAPASFDNNDILAVKVTASNGKTVGYLKITVKVGGSAFLASLKVNNKDIALGLPKAAIALNPEDFNPYSNMGPAYRVEDGEDLTASAATWPIAAEPVDPGAAVSWALAAKNAVPQAGDFGASTSFDTSHNYLFIKVVSKAGDKTMYYLVIFDERPRDTEHLKTGGKSVPIYKFTIPQGKTWGDLGDSPVLKVTMLMEQEQWDRADGYHRNFSFGELQRMVDQYTYGTVTFDKENWSFTTGSASFQVFMPYLFNNHPKKVAIDPATGEYDQNIASVGQWFTVKYPFTGTEHVMKQPWDANTDWDYQNSYQVLPSDSSVTYNFYPEASATGDQYFGIGITHDGPQEYYVKALSLESADGSFKIACDLTGGGRIDGDGAGKGYVYVTTQPDNTTDGYMREMVSDPTLK